MWRESLPLFQRAAVLRACLLHLVSNLWPCSFLVISVVRLDKGNFAGTKLPHYEALRGERPPDLETTVILPESVFRGQLGTWMW